MNTIKSITSTEAEQAVLGSLLFDNTLSFKLDELHEGCFYDNYNKEIFKVMMELKSEKKIIDIISVKSKLDVRGVNLDVSYLSELTSICSSYNVDSYIEILKEKYARRCVVNKCQKLINSISLGENLDVGVFNFENEIKGVISGEVYEDDICSISQSVLDLLDGSSNPKIKFGIDFLDEVVGGLFKGELTTIAAKSGVGKTALALQIMLNAFKQGKKVLFITREMSKEQIIMRNLTKKTGINTNKMKSNEICGDDWKKIVEGLAEMNEGNLIYVNDKISTVAQIRRRIRQLKVDLLIVDYVQLMTPTMSMQNREREVASISRDLKSITLDFDMSVIQLSQLNDEMKDFRPKGERPMRESKALYHDSNNVIYIHEPSEGDLESVCRKIGHSKDSIAKAIENGVKIVELIVAKCRDGEKRYKYFMYDGKRLHFQNLKEDIGGIVC